MTKNKKKIFLICLFFSISSCSNLFNYNSSIPINNIGDFNDPIEPFESILRIKNPLDSEKMNFTIEWSRTWGGSGYNYGRNVIVDSSNNIYFAERSMTLLKYNSSGDLKWTVSFPMTMEDKGLAFDSSENIYAAGYRGSSNNRNASLVKFDNDGNEIWNRTWGSNTWDDARAVAVDSNDNVFITGMTKSFGDSGGDIYIIKYNSSGHEQWIRHWNNQQGDIAYDISVDSKDNIYVTGISYISHDEYICLIKYDTNGNQLWNRTTTFNNDFDVNTRAITIDSLDNVYIGGQTGVKYSTDYDIFLIKYTEHGIKQWERLFGGDLFDDCSDLLIDPKNFIYIGGRTISYTAGGDIDMLLMKCNSSGGFINLFVWGGAEKDECWGIAKDSKGNFLLGGNTGSTNYDLCLVKLNPMPIIHIFSPKSHIHYHEIAPDFNVSITDNDVELQWYTLNDGSIHYFLSSVGVINQTTWSSCQNGTVSIKFFASDHCGAVKYEEVKVHKGIIKIEQKKNAYAIIIGIEDYPGTSNDLFYCRDDALSIRNILTNEYNLETSNMISLLDTQATESAIINAFNNMSSRLNEDDIFLFYYSGHGGDDVILGEYLCPYDSIPNDPSHLFYDTDLNYYLGLLSCVEKYVIVDACNSGGLILESQDTGRFILTACQDNELSYESSELQHGVFTYYFIHSVSAATDSNQDGGRSLEELFSYIYSHTVSYIDDLGGAQHPQKYDGIYGHSIIYPSVTSFTINIVGNILYFSFDLNGHGSVEIINLTVCSVANDILLEIKDLTLFSPHCTGLGYYWGAIELVGSNIITGYELLIEIEGYQKVTFYLSSGDTDCDNLDDIFEIQNGLDPRFNDTDGDGLNDYTEFYGPTNPLLKDTDGDGILDGYEVFNDLDPLTNDANLDYDGDGLINILEYTLGTYANNPDSDGDVMPDGWEYNNDLDLFTNDTALDPDQDGLSNLDEYQIGTDPQLEDTDGDTWSDGDEVAHDTDPLDPEDHPEIPVAISGFVLVPLVTLLLICGIIIGKKAKSKILN